MSLLSPSAVANIGTHGLLLHRCSIMQNVVVCLSRMAMTSPEAVAGDLGTFLFNWLYFALTVCVTARVSARVSVNEFAYL